MSEVTDLYAWLARSACQQYHANFVKHDITFDLLSDLDSDALRELGVLKVGDRIRLEIAIAELKLATLKKKVPLKEIREYIEKEQVPIKRVPTSEKALLSPGATTSRIVTFILPDGSLLKVNVEGCFSAQLIKKKVLKKLGVHDDDNEYDTFVHMNVSGDIKISSLYDVEFVTICFSPDRPEKHRIMLTPKNEAPTPTATAKSLRIVQRLSGKKPTNPSIRSFFGQRPPSELISSNLGEYFPTAGLHALETTIRNSVRHSMRVLRRFNSSSSVLNVLLGRPSITSEERWYRGVHQQRTIGDVLVHNVTMLDEAKISSDRSNRHSRIELMNVESENEDEDNLSEALDEFDFCGGKKWLQGARIGAGSFGTVYLGMNPMSGELMAVKQVPIPTGSSKQNEVHRSMISALQREMAILKELNHENIVLYYGLSSDANFLNIFLEYIPGGSVQLMLHLYGPFEEPLIRNFIRQVLVGLSYLHGVDIIHRDIKGANILIDIKGIAKISDFGISKKVNTTDEEKSNDTTGKQAKRASLQGLVYWMAPEVVKQTAYTKKADIWSVGCLVVEMFTGRHPFPSFSQMQAIFKIGTHTRPEVPKWCTIEGQDFLNKTFEFDYSKRPSAVELLADSFLAPLIVSDTDNEKRSAPVAL
ncbi:Pkinase-domain-containing protein [Metschnikowia bicuspidata var. bicuspidata NRRL YB-4993]|uniref:mitogen-activated protein kinase kinase kinase n=1 Tax=Metschnikowia bicuspidata var. bicuspidata NRRL YB-4993 TaxID=869754 RepID=A0A1A0H7Y7_9ASCO|nr:Pkinase-domain-containing protein [Metschnikowia bicuspidata var. bicuspidata NRRL YB-4993]OBA20007.1 Pkinase-domain-containing protein [Metschnikowia bicuspidata var. bicuspidata NRRL YB-4993]